MREKRCDVPGCGRLIEGTQLALQPATVKVPSIGQMTVAVTFKGRRPDMCNYCVLAAIATLGQERPSAKVVELPVSRGGRQQ
jgi:hypothetical protein